jgi:hypothetical protein
MYVTSARYCTAPEECCDFWIGTTSLGRYATRCSIRDGIGSVRLGFLRDQNARAAEQNIEQSSFGLKSSSIGGETYPMGFSKKAGRLDGERGCGRPRSDEELMTAPGRDAVQVQDGPLGLELGAMSSRGRRRAARVRRVRGDLQEQRASLGCLPASGRRDRGHRSDVSGLAFWVWSVVPALLSSLRSDLSSSISDSHLPWTDTHTRRRITAMMHPSRPLLQIRTAGRGPCHERLPAYRTTTLFRCLAVNPAGLHVSGARGGVQDPKQSKWGSWCSCSAAAG